jgi:hypothetical protein
LAFRLGCVVEQLSELARAGHARLVDHHDGVRRKPVLSADTRVASIEHLR